MTDSALKQRLTEDMKAAMRSKDKPRLGVVRLVLAAIKQREVDERIDLDDTQVLAVLDKMVKQRRDSVKQFEDAGRQELADQESYEISVLQEYLPAALDGAELDALIVAAIDNTGAESMKDMGKVMAVLKPQVQGRADMGAVSQQIKSRLGG
ncbi:MAG: GatB/YqeY domain-containing protein [Gammaproteobacteria bacterium]|nr:GatB/YqeY domain-containing protein [Gammaproteobacteria bacterium]